MEIHREPMDIIYWNPMLNHEQLIGFLWDPNRKSMRTLRKCFGKAHTNPMGLLWESDENPMRISLESDGNLKWMLCRNSMLIL